MFGGFGGWLNKIARKATGASSAGGAQEHYAWEAAKAAEDFEDNILPPHAEEAEGEELTVFEPNIEAHDFEGESTDIEWMTYNHDTNELIIKYLEHGENTQHSHIYSYQNIPVEEFEDLKTGVGSYPSWRDPRFYQKHSSTGQRANYYIRNDHADDLYEYNREVGG